MNADRMSPRLAANSLLSFASGLLAFLGTLFVLLLPLGDLPFFVDEQPWVAALFFVIESIALTTAGGVAAVIAKRAPARHALASTLAAAIYVFIESLRLFLRPHGEAVWFLLCQMLLVPSIGLAAGVAVGCWVHNRRTQAALRSKQSRG